MYICKYCGREFEKQQGWCSHQSKCKLNPNRNKALSHLDYARKCRDTDTNKEYVCQYCGKICKGKISLVQHEIRCKENPNSINYNTNQKSNFIKYNQECRDGIKHHPHKGQTKYTSDSLYKTYKTKHEKYKTGELEGGFKGKSHSKTTKEKMRKSAIKYLKQTEGFNGPRYNKKSISFIDNLNTTNNWQLQHAENDGEVEILGYFVDGYDKVLNIVFEFDEPAHYKDIENSILKDKDIERQNNIINHLNCRFFRYNEALDYLYEIFI